MILENVEGFGNKEAGQDISPLELLKQRLSEANYVVTHHVLDNGNFIGCSRKRTSGRGGGELARVFRPLAAGKTSRQV